MKFIKTLAVLSLLIVFASIPMIVSAASPVHVPAAGHVYQVAETESPLSDFVETAKNLGGFALLFAALFNVGKAFNWVKDGQAPAYNLVFQTASVVLLVVLQLTGKTDLVPAIDQSAGLIANGITAVLAIVFNLLVSRLGHENVLAGLPVVGTSFSGRNAGEGALLSVTEDLQVGEVKSSITKNFNDR